MELLRCRLQLRFSFRVGRPFTWNLLRCHCFFAPSCSAPGLMESGRDCSRLSSRLSLSITTFCLLFTHGRQSPGRFHALPFSLFQPCLSEPLSLRKGAPQNRSDARSTIC